MGRLLTSVLKRVTPLAELPTEPDCSAPYDRLADTIEQHLDISTLNTD